MQQPPPLPERCAPARREPRPRHWRWAMPLAVVSGLALVGGATAWTLARWHSAAHESPPLREAVRRAGCHPELVAVFGEPLQAEGMPLGSMRTHINGGREVGLTVNLHGPQHRGRLFVQGDRVEGVWDYPVMYVLADNEETYDLSAVDDAEAAAECRLEACRAEGSCPALTSTNA